MRLEHASSKARDAKKYYTLSAGLESNPRTTSLAPSQRTPSWRDDSDAAFSFTSRFKLHLAPWWCSAGAGMGESPDGTEKTVAFFDECGNEL